MPPRKRVKTVVRKKIPKSTSAAASASVAAEAPATPAPSSTKAVSQPETPALQSPAPSFSETLVSETTGSELAPLPTVKTPSSPSRTPLATDARPAALSEPERDATPMATAEAVAKEIPATGEPSQASSAKTTTTRVRKVIKKKIIKRMVPKAAFLTSKQEEKKVLEEAAAMAAEEVASKQEEVASKQLAESFPQEEENPAPISQQDPKNPRSDTSIVLQETVRPVAMGTENVALDEKKNVIKKKVIRKKIIKKRIPKVLSPVKRQEDKLAEEMTVALPSEVMDTKPVEAASSKEKNPAHSPHNHGNSSLDGAVGNDETVKLEDVGNDKTVKLEDVGNGETIKPEAVGTNNVGLKAKKKIIKKVIIKKRIPKAAYLAGKNDKVLEAANIVAEKVVSKTPAEGALEDKISASISLSNPPNQSLNATINCAESVPSEVMDTDHACLEEKKKHDKVEGQTQANTEDEEAGILERQKRRKTEVFIGGLDRDAKEEDVRKVFSKVGEIMDIRIIMDNQIKKNKGYAFLKYKEPVHAKKAISELSEVKICGKLCRVAAVEGNDTIFLGNLDKKWKKEDVLKLLQDVGIKKINTVTLMLDPNKAGLNRGFAFLELESNRDAQIAYKKLQNIDAFGKGRSIKVDWAQLDDPDEEEMEKVKSVYAEGIPSSWDENKVRQVFKKFGEIERVGLACNMPSAKRKDFAIVTYITRQAALTCIDMFDKEELTENGSKLYVKVSLANPSRKRKQNNGPSKFTVQEKDKQEKTQRTGLPVYSYAAPGGARAYSSLIQDMVHSDLRGYTHAHIDSSFPVAGSSVLAHGIPGVSSLYYQRPEVGYPSGSLYTLGQRYGPQQRQGFPPYGGNMHPRY